MVKSEFGGIMQVGVASWSKQSGDIGSLGFDFEPDVILYFGDGDILPVAHNHLRELSPDSILLGCSSGGQIFGATPEVPEFVAAAMKFDSTKIKSARSDVGEDTDSAAAGKNIGEQLAADDLAGIIVLSDGMNTNGSDLVEGIYKSIKPGVPVVGGLAGDGDRFEKTLVGLNDVLTDGQVAAIGLYGNSLRLGHGSEGGWRPFGPRRTVTRSDGNILYELDGKPALDLYEKYLGEEAVDLPSSALMFPLLVSDPGDPDSEITRTILNIDREERSLIFAGNVPQGSIAQLMKTTHEGLLAGAAEAATKTRNHVSNGELALMVSCIGRRLVMRQRADEEVEAATDELGQNMPRIGFYSYGEICPKTIGGSPRLHNQTMTISVISEDSGVGRA